MLIAVSQINQAALTAFVATASSGAALSGSLAAYFAASGTVGNNVVYTYGDQLITGRKTYLLSPNVPYIDGTGRAPSALYVLNQDLAVSGVLNGYVNTLSGFVLGASGALSIVRVTGSSPISSANLTGLGGTLVIYSGGQIFISGAAGGGGGGSNLSVTGSAAISAPNLTGAGSVFVSYDGTYVLVSGAAGGDPTLSGYVENAFVHRGPVNDVVSGLKTFTGAVSVGSPTATGHAINLGYLTGVSGALVGQSTIINTGGNTLVFNLSGITGNFVNMSFWFDEYSLSTGLNLIESFVGRSFFFTGYALGAITPVTQGTFSGSFYQRTQSNTKASFVSFGMGVGQFSSGRGGFSQEVTGMNRVGLDIYLIGTGLTGVSVGLFGVGY